MGRVGNRGHGHSVKSHFLLCSSAGVELPSLPPEASVLTPGKMGRLHGLPSFV